MTPVPATFPPMTFAEKLNNLIAARGWTQARLADTAKIRPDRISRWLSGEGKPWPEHVLAMARALGVTTDYLCDESLSSPDQGPTEHSGRYAKVLPLIDVMGVDEAYRRLLMLGDRPGSSAGPVAEPPSTPTPKPKVKRRPK